MAQAAAKPDEVSAAIATRSPGLTLSALPTVALRTLDHLAPAPDLACPSFSRGTAWNLGVRVEALTGPTPRTFDAPPAGLAAYRATRDSAEHAQLDLSAGLRLEARTDGGLLLRAGADYQLYRSRMDLPGTATIRREEVEVRDELTGQLIRTDTVVTVTRTSRRVYNRIHTVSLAAGIGYAPTLGAVRPYLIAEAGYEWTLSARGVYPTAAGGLHELPPTGQWIAEAPGLWLGASAGVDVLLTDRLAVGLVLRARRLGGLRGAADPLTYRQVGLSGGLSVGWRL